MKALKEYELSTSEAVKMKDIEMDVYPDGSYGICFGCKEYVRYLNPHTEGIVKLEIKLKSDSKEIEDAEP